MRPIQLPPKLRALVRVVQAALGEVIRDAEGPALYETIEEVRRSMVSFREARGAGSRQRALASARSRIAASSAAGRAKLARAYTLYLELANACENAYRTHRLRTRPGPARRADEAEVIFVLTAHPTESRSPENIRVLRRVQDLLVEAADRGEDPRPDELRHLLRLLWRLGTHPRHRPTVIDEADHLFSLLSDPILEELIDLARSGRRVRLRSWVGGDKDGHPGVGPRESVASLQRSRARLLEFVERGVLRELAGDSLLLGSPALEEAAVRLRRAAEALAKVREKDGARVVELRRSAVRLHRAWNARVGGPHPALERLELLLLLFPGLVVPLELREERGRFEARAPLAAMLSRLTAVARGGRLEAYVAGVVVSMTTRPDDVLEACALVERITGGPGLPVIPLIELPEALDRAVEILDGAFRGRAFRDSVRRGAGRVEVMLGYSDTAKRMGVLASRLAIGDAMQAIGTWGREKGIPVLFFHGSGGSVGRGGGTFADRAAGWPRDALVPHKETLQGEMVERTLASPEILRSNVEKIARIQARPPRFVPAGDFLRNLAGQSRRAFADLVRSPELLTLLSRATPYESLGRLTIGSRPAKRAGAEPTLESLRAIPWVLCWTQTRYLLHAWLGVGTAWRRLRSERGAAARLCREVRADPLLRAYLRALGFTLAKCEPTVWKAYVATLAPDLGQALLRRFERERQDALDLARTASPDGELLHDRRWLLESIRYRAPMIHPLNLLQIRVLERAREGRRRAGDDELFRETVTGIAAGMLTTG